MQILITAGPVYGRLDDNKLVSNRAKGDWAAQFAQVLAQRGHVVTLLISDTLKLPGSSLNYDGIEILRHHGFEEYASICYEKAPKIDAAVMAAAVTNWIPAQPQTGKMPTKGYKENDTILVPFKLAERVITRMKVINPRMTLIGCKMLSGETDEELIEAAYAGVLLPAKCNLVIANDLSNLKRKLLVYQDRAVFEYVNDFSRLYEDLYRVLTADHYRSSVEMAPKLKLDTRLFDAVVERYRAHFVHRHKGTDRVFGAVCTRSQEPYGWILSPREKGQAFNGEDAVLVTSTREGRVHVLCSQGNKATLNSPLMIRMLLEYPEAEAVLHLHEQLPNVITMPYASPGTKADSLREIPGPVFNIEGHGFIACLDKNLNFLT